MFVTDIIEPVSCVRSHREWRDHSWPGRTTRQDHVRRIGTAVYEVEFTG